MSEAEDFLKLVLPRLTEADAALHNGDAGPAEPEAYALRVTTIFRRENGEWKAVYRHGDPMPDSVSAREQLAGFGEGRPSSR